MFALKDILSRYHAVLAGGTALALRLGHRISVDLDFFTDREFKVEAVIGGIRKTGHPFHVMSEGEGELVVDLDGVKVALFKYEYPFIEKPFIHKGIAVAGTLDIAAMKIIAIGQRGTKRDFVDLFFILQEVPFHKVAEHMVKRFGRERISPVHIGKSLVYFSDAEAHPDPEYCRGKAAHWDKIKKFFRSHAKQFVLDLDAAVKDKG